MGGIISYYRRVGQLRPPPNTGLMYMTSESSGELMYIGDQYMEMCTITEIEKDLIGEHFDSSLSHMDAISVIRGSGSAEAALKRLQQHPTGPHRYCIYQSKNYKHPDDEDLLT